jgi:NAD(P)H-dependent flavin oxidoreductase YrpB (nitropropane dioxygenase family)
MRKSRELTWSQLAMAANAPMLTRASMVDGKLEVGILPTGQVVGLIDALPTVAEVVDDIMREADETLARLAGDAPQPRLAGEQPAVVPRRERA